MKTDPRCETLHLCFDQVTVIPAKGRPYRVKTASWESPNHSASWGHLLPLHRPDRHLGPGSFHPSDIGLQRFS